MKILAFGSLNFDHIYQTDHFVIPQETLAVNSYQRGLGGKGFNQTCALAKAGLEVYQAGRIGQDGEPFKLYLQQQRVNTDFLVTDEKEPTGHAIIELSQAQNRILIYGGANQQISPEQINRTLAAFDAGDWIILQNEISNIPYLLEKAHERKLSIFFNAAPFSAEVKNYPLDLATILCVNEIEGGALAGLEPGRKAADIINQLTALYPKTAILLTCGAGGSYYADSRQHYFAAAPVVKAVDTTAAGDTYSGYFLAALVAGAALPAAMKLATAAAALAIQKAGAAASIPTMEEVRAYEQNTSNS